MYKVTIMKSMDIRMSICPPKPELLKRNLISRIQATELSEVFKVLSGETRLIMLHALAKEPELSVNELAEKAELKPQAVSNHLQRLVDQGILDRRRSGVQILYRVIDPCVMDLLEKGLCLTEEAKKRRS
jgi:DNA-binding transcriptional ArsR family regulator